MSKNSSSATTDATAPIVKVSDSINLSYNAYDTDYTADKLNVGFKVLFGNYMIAFCVVGLKSFNLVTLIKFLEV